MANSRELHDPFTLYYLSEVIHDEEFILLYDVFSSKNLNLPYEDYQRFSFDHMEPDECKAEFRFWKTTSPCLLMFYKYQQIWFVLKELFLVDWKAFSFYLEDWRIHVDTVIYYKNLVDQCLSCLL